MKLNILNLKIFLLLIGLIFSFEVFSKTTITNTWFKIFYIKNELNTPISICVSLPNIYFKKGESKIDSNHQIFLDTLVLFLNENPSVTLNILGFTDSKGDFRYNLDLSKQRAKNVFKYLNQKGIKKRRVKLFWYGESILKNLCKDDVDCSEEMHQLNRRVEFQVIFPKDSN